MEGIGPFERLALEHERTQFHLYGAAHADGSPMTGPYFKLANSLREALADLAGNPGIADDGGYFARDAFITRAEDGDVVVHVEVISGNSLRRSLDEPEEEDEDDG